MSQENVERVRQGLALFNQAEFEAVLRDLFHPDIELTPGIGRLGVGTIRGREAVRRFWLEDLPQALDEFRIEPIGFEDFGDVVLVENRYRARGPGSGMEISQDFVTAYSFRDGFVHRIRDHGSRAEALEACGLSSAILRPVSEEKVEIVRQWLRAFNERDLDALVALTTPDIEFVPYFASLIEATTYRGHDGLRRYLDDAAAVWDQIEGRVESVRVVGERAVVRGELRGKGKTSGLDVRVPLGWVADFEGKRIARIETFASEAEALEAAGLAE